MGLGSLAGVDFPWHLQVEHLVKLAGFAATRSATGESERKTLRDLLVALRDCRLLGQTVTRAELAVKTGSSFLTRPKGKDTWLASAGEALLYARMPDEDEDEPTQKVFVLAAGDKFPLPADAPSCDALDLVIVPRARDIGGFEVRRALPAPDCSTTWCRCWGLPRCCSGDRPRCPAESASA